MKQKHLLIASAAISLALAGSISFGDDDDDHDNMVFKRTSGVAPVTSELYQKECGSCHFAYQPGLLPEQSWNKIKKGLHDHFGDNAELSTEVNQKILSYLTSNSADKSDSRRSRKIMRSISPSSPPLRITEVPYFIRKHDEIPQRLIKDNDKVASLGHCDACHQQASTGSFSERQIRIPGYGKWDD